jgi:light-regulated signal transduction histidine kinase (bacteriophytochrome)
LVNLLEDTQAAKNNLEKTTQRLKAANAELESFSYSVSHDLRAPLRAIDGFSRILLEEHSIDLSSVARRYLGLVRENSQHMGQLIDGLLTFSRLGRKSLSLQSIAPADIVRSVLESLRDEQEGRHIDVSIGELPSCYADPVLLRQVYMNLISNAIKFTAKREVAQIDVGCEVDGNENVYYVRDNGAGFDMRYVDKLFGVFQRLHHDDEYEGTGVGLAIIQRIVRRHGGRVWARGEVDKGAVFYFTLGGALDE